MTSGELSAVAYAVVPVVLLQMVAVWVEEPFVRLQREQIIEVLRSDGSVVQLVTSPSTSSVSATNSIDRRPGKSSKASIHGRLL